MPALIILGVNFKRRSTTSYSYVAVICYVLLSVMSMSKSKSEVTCHMIIICHMGVLTQTNSILYIVNCETLKHTDRHEA